MYTNNLFELSNFFELIVLLCFVDDAAEDEVRKLIEGYNKEIEVLRLVVL